MAPTPPVPALSQEIEAGIDSLRTDGLRHGHPRVFKDLHLLAQIHTHSEPPPGFIVRRNSVPLNDTTGRPRRVYRKTPPPPKNRNRRHSTPDAAAPADEIGDAASPLNNATARQERVLTPPPSRSNASEAVLDTPPSASHPDDAGRGWLTEA
ncbi:hypothetical protein T484DRAFT_1881720 [Baffinella frigidus]|nr:hypothetical protein T484DRAFT_1881720 [Cryptophyta sp. CCMP2293]